MIRFLNHFVDFIIGVIADSLCLEVGQEVIRTDVVDCKSIRVDVTDDFHDLLDDRVGFGV